jgi:hypothetical protein
LQLPRLRDGASEIRAQTVLAHVVDDSGGNARDEIECILPTEGYASFADAFSKGLNDLGYVEVCNLILTHVTGKKHPKLPRFSTLFKGLARDSKIPSCIY